MEEALSIFLRVSSQEREKHGTVARGPPVEKISQEIERLFPPSSGKAVEETSPDEEKKEIDNSFVQELPNSSPDDHNSFLSSPKRGLMSASTSAFTKPIIERNVSEDVTVTRRTKGNRSVDYEEWSQSNSQIYGSDHQSQSQSQCMSPPKQPLNPTATNAMARHVVNKLRKDAIGMIAAGDTNANAASTPYYRRPSPIARIRESSFHDEFNEMNPDADANDNDNDNDNDNPVKEPKSEREVKDERSRQWKKKAKIAKAKQRRERQKKAALDDRTVGTESIYGSNPLIGCVLDNVEKTDFFQRITSCGGGTYYRRPFANNDPEESEYESASSAASDGEFDSEEDNTEHETTESETPGKDNGGKRERAGRQGNKKLKSIGSRDTSSTGPSVDTTVPEEMNESFLTDDGAEHHEGGWANRSRFELNRSMEAGNSLAATLGGRSNSNTSEYAFAAFSSSLDGSISQNKAARDNNYTSGSNHAPAHMKAFLQDMESKGESMLWHQETSAIDPTTVVLRLKKGYRLPSGTYCAPRLIWTDLRNNHNYGFDVFDIRSLDHASMLHLKDFPYAIPGRSVLLHLRNSTSYIFEAGTEEDVARFVRGIKWVIARLARNLILGNFEGSCEMLDLGFGVRSTGSEFDWSRAMDDVTDILIDNALASTFEVYEMHHETTRTTAYYNL